MTVLAIGASAQVSASHAYIIKNHNDQNDSEAPPPSSTLKNFNEVTTGWLQCTGSCAGGSNPSSTEQKFGISSPSLDDESMLLGLTGPDSCPTGGCKQGPNNGWYLDTGADDTNTSFELNLYFNIASTTNVVALEFDQFQYLLATGEGGVSQNTRLYFGTQCVTGGDWWVWDSNGGGWIDTDVGCSYTVSSTKFNHLIIKVHRVSGDTSCEDGYPCMHYDSISVNGTVKVSDKTTNAGPLPSGWGEQTGFMLQMDGSIACLSSCTISEYIDEGSFTY